MHKSETDLPFHQRFMLTFLADTDHRVLASGHSLLPNCPVARHIPWIHARVVGALEATLFTVALVKLAGTVSARGHLAKFKQLVRAAVSACK